MQDESLYQSLSFVSDLQRELDVCRYQLDNIMLNLTSDSYQCAFDDPRNHPCFEVAHRFFSFLHKNHPEILDEWRETNNKTKQKNEL